MLQLHSAAEPQSRAGLNQRPSACLTKVASESRMEAVAIAREVRKSKDKTLREKISRG